MADVVWFGESVWVKLSNVLSVCDTDRSTTVFVLRLCK
jgi:hypothetical protein